MICLDSREKIVMKYAFVYTTYSFQDSPYSSSSNRFADCMEMASLHKHRSSTDSDLELFTHFVNQMLNSENQEKALLFSKTGFDYDFGEYDNATRFLTNNQGRISKHAKITAGYEDNNSEG